MKHEYLQDLGLAVATTDEHQAVASLLYNPGSRTPAILASALAAYSRSKKGIRELLEYRKERGINGEEVIDRIISEYNHPSVMGLGHLYVALEGVSEYDAMRFFYNHHLQDGQARSTRFQNYSKPRTYAPCPVADSAGYYDVLDYWLDGYEHFYPLVRGYLKQRFEVDDDCPALNPRTLDCVRYLVPIGTSTNVGAVQSGREWSKWIATLRGYGQYQLADAMEVVLRYGWDGYVPEGDVLIRYTDPWDNPVADMEDLVSNHYGSMKAWHTDLPINLLDSFRVCTTRGNEYFHGSDPLLVHLHLLWYPYTEDCTINSNIPELPALLAQRYDWKHEMGPVGHSGDIAIHGLADMGTLKDLIRHRSSPAFIPLLHDEEEEVMYDRLYTIYAIHPYLIGTDVGEQMCEYIERGYQNIRGWCPKNTDDKAVNRAMKNLLPHAHVTPYIFYGSANTFMAYICNLRAKPGGHMAYRQLAHAWALEIGTRWPLWGGLIPPEPQLSRGEFVDRS